MVESQTIAGAKRSCVDNRSATATCHESSSTMDCYRTAKLRMAPSEPASAPLSVHISHLLADDNEPCCRSINQAPPPPHSYSKAGCSAARGPDSVVIRAFGHGRFYTSLLLFLPRNWTLTYGAVQLWQQKYEKPPALDDDTATVSCRCPEMLATFSRWQIPREKNQKKNETRNSPKKDADKARLINYVLVCCFCCYCWWGVLDVLDRCRLNEWMMDELRRHNLRAKIRKIRVATASKKWKFK